MSELKPCPFCGSSAALRSSAVTGIHCNNNFCGLESPSYANDDVEKLIRWWNTRPADAVREAARDVLACCAVNTNHNIWSVKWETTLGTPIGVAPFNSAMARLRAALAQDGRRS